MIREVRKRKKRRKTGLYIFLFLVLLIAVGAVVVTQVFTVENVVVEGNELYSSKQIENMVLDDEYSWNSLYVYLKYRFVDIGEVPFVDTMEVSLDSPHTVHIKVYEKGMLGYLYIDSIGQNAYFDKDGFVVETSTDVIEGVPKITGIKCNEVVLYEKLTLENTRILRDLLTLTQTLKKYELLPDEISYNSNMEPVLYYGPIQVNVGSEDNLSQKVVRLSIILPQLSGLSGTLHLEAWTPETTDIIWDRAEDVTPEEQPETDGEQQPDTEGQTQDGQQQDGDGQQEQQPDAGQQPQGEQQPEGEQQPQGEQQPEGEQQPQEEQQPDAGQQQDGDGQQEQQPQQEASPEEGQTTGGDTPQEQ